jgi:two-component system response regulator FixJ
VAEDATVYVIDDDEGVRRTLAYVLGSAGFATRLFATAEAFVAEPAPRAEAGCVLTDVRLPGMTGLALVKWLKDTGSRCTVVVMSGVGDIDMAVAAMKLGAADFLQKPLRPTKTVAAIREAMEREGRRARQALDTTPYRKTLALLSPRQRDVLEGILGGKLNKTIAHELGISVRTVEGYRAEIMAKTRAESLSELIRMAVIADL